MNRALEKSIRLCEGAKRRSAVFYRSPNTENDLGNMLGGLTNEKVFFPNLDGFRFLSFLLVFLCHGFAEVINTRGEGGLIFTTFKIGLFQSAQVGVSFFFVLSGFLITYLILKEQDRHKKLDIKAFYLRRILRIWPLHYALLIIAFILFPVFFQLKLPNPLYYIFFLANFARGERGVLGVMWSVAVEEQFYLVWPLLFRLCRRQYLIYLFIGIIAVSSLFRWVNQQSDNIHNGHTLTVISDLAIGGLAAYCIISFPWFQRLFFNLSKWKIAAAYFIILTAALFSRFLYLNALFGRVLLCGLLAFIILEQNFSKNSFYKMKNFLTISSLGKYTYGLYLLHPLIIFLVYKVADHFNISKSTTLSGGGLSVLIFFLSVLICYISYHYYEEPFLRLKKRYAYIRTEAA